jgi:hypothetical protein
VFAVVTTTRPTHEQLRLRRRRSVSCNGNRRGANQDSMTKNADCDYRVTAKGDTKTDRPHKPQGLQNQMSPFDIWNMTQRTYIGIEDKIPSENDKLSHGAVLCYH